MAYHATLLLPLGAHINMQKINTDYWSYYLLKYTMKSEPHGPIQLDKTKAERLGQKTCLKYSTAINLLSHYIEANFSYGSNTSLPSLPGNPKSRIVEYIDSNPPMLRTKLVTKSRVFGFHPIDAYSNKSITFESMTFFQYFERFETNRI